MRSTVLDPDDLTVRNGTHRVVAALRTGVAIDVTFGEPKTCPDSDLRTVTFTVEVVDPALAALWSGELAGNETAALDAGVGALTSIAHDGGWLNALCFGGRGGALEATWVPTAGSTMPDDERLTEVLVARAAQAGLDLRVLTISHDPGWLHDEPAR